MKKPMLITMSAVLSVGMAIPVSAADVNVTVNGKQVARSVLFQTANPAFALTQQIGIEDRKMR